MFSLSPVLKRIPFLRVVLFFLFGTLLFRSSDVSPGSFAGVHGLRTRRSSSLQSSIPPSRVRVLFVSLQRSRRRIAHEDSLSRHLVPTALVILREIFARESCRCRDRNAFKSFLIDLWHAKMRTIDFFFIIPLLCFRQG